MLLEMPAVFPPMPTSVRFKNLTGQKFGRLLVAGYAGRQGHESIWWCRCDCGGVSRTAKASLKGGKSGSCGCLLREIVSALFFKHGATSGRVETREFVTWKSMIQRCSDPNTIGWKNYGGRGIKVCERWLSFENFLADMGERPEGKSLDRHPNQDGNYEPGNCRWATKKQQARNKTNNRLIVVDGISMTLAEACECYGVRPGLLRDRIERGWSPERALTTKAAYKDQSWRAAKK